MTARVILHLPRKVHQTFRSMKLYGLHAAIERSITARGGTVLLADRGEELYALGTLPGDGDLHIVENGSAQGPGYLNTAVAYLDGFFHLDPQGVLADSSLRHLDYDPSEIDETEARAFFRRLKARFVNRRHSRYGQPRAVADLPDGAIAVFLQGPKPERHGQAHLSTQDMLRAVARAAGGRPVLVKLHPAAPAYGAEKLALARQSGLSFLETEANVHDILAKAAVSVSINSACGFEGFLHGTPAIFFGRSDFHHAVETVHRIEDFPRALDRALTRRRNYAKAMYWYFGQHGFWLDDPALEAKLLAQFTAQGFPPDRLGLTRG